MPEATTLPNGRRPVFFGNKYTLQGIFKNTIKIFKTSKKI